MKRFASNEPEGAASGKRARKSQSMVDLVYENIIKTKCLRISSSRMEGFADWGARLAREAHVLDVCRSHNFDGSMAEYARDEALSLVSDTNVDDFDIINALCTTLPEMGLDATVRDILREGDLVYRDLMIEHSEHEHEYHRALKHKFLLAIARAWDVSTNRGEMVNELTTYYTLRCLSEKVGVVIDIPYLEHEKPHEIPKMWAIEQFFHLLQGHEKDMDPLFRLLYSTSSEPMEWSSSMNKNNEPSFSSWQLRKDDILGDVPFSEQEYSESEDEDESSSSAKEEGEVVLETEDAEDETMIKQLREKGTLDETAKHQLKERFPENLRFSESMTWWTKIAYLYE